MADARPSVLLKKFPPHVLRNWRANKNKHTHTHTHHVQHMHKRAIKDGPCG